MTDRDALVRGYIEILEDGEGEVRITAGLRLGLLFEQASDFARAEETYRYVLTLAPGDPEATMGIERILRRVNLT